jgi:hypothetical protein
MVWGLGSVADVAAVEIARLEKSRCRREAEGAGASASADSLVMRQERSRWCPRLRLARIIITLMTCKRLGDDLLPASVPSLPTGGSCTTPASFIHDSAGLEHTHPHFTLEPE